MEQAHFWKGGGNLFTDASAADIRRAGPLYFKTCAMRQGAKVRSGGSIPDLRQLTAGHRELFEDVVLNGILASRGMTSFADDMLNTRRLRLKRCVVQDN
ncbi:MAG: hypothetical protein ACJAUG_000158 [Halioglobus sp.]